MALPSLDRQLPEKRSGGIGAALQLPMNGGGMISSDGAGTRIPLNYHTCSDGLSACSSEWPSGRGRVTVNVLPTPNSDVTARRPPCASTSIRER
jgi:hypothetical protein